MKFIPHRSDGRLFDYGARYGWIGLLVGALTALPISLILFYFFDSFVFFGLPIFFGMVGYFVRRIVLPKNQHRNEWMVLYGDVGIISIMQDAHF